MSKLVFSDHILIDNESDRDDILKYYESKGILWSSRDVATEYVPNIPFLIVYNWNGSRGELLATQNINDYPHITYSEFLKRKDSPYTFYKRGNTLLLVHYKGSGIEIRLNGARNIYPSGTSSEILLYLNIFNNFHLETFTPLIGPVKIKTKGIMVNEESILFVQINDIKLDSKGISYYNKSYDDFNYVDYVVI